MSCTIATELEHDIVHTHTHTHTHNQPILGWADNSGGSEGRSEGKGDRMYQVN